ncbi:hypothetical protein D3C87_1317080 [compost metagenome]
MSVADQLTGIDHHGMRCASGNVRRQATVHGMLEQCASQQRRVSGPGSHQCRQVVQMAFTEDLIGAAEGFEQAQGKGFLLVGNLRRDQPGRIGLADFRRGIGHGAYHLPTAGPSRHVFQGHAGHQGNHQAVFSANLQVGKLLGAHGQDDHITTSHQRLVVMRDRHLRPPGIRERVAGAAVRQHQRIGLDKSLVEHRQGYRAAKPSRSTDNAYRGRFEHRNLPLSV